MSLHATIAALHPKLTRGQIWCRRCGNTARVSAAACLRHGWPECCGCTMTIDAPCEREAAESGEEAER